jgi:hypothetical protein
LEGGKASLPFRSGLTSSFTNLGNQCVPNLERIKKNTSFCYPARRERPDKKPALGKPIEIYLKFHPVFIRKEQDQPTHMHGPSHAFSNSRTRFYTLDHITALSKPFIENKYIPKATGHSVYHAMYLKKVH